MRAAETHRTLARLASRGAALRIDTPELCCLAAMYLQAHHSGVSLFAEEQLAGLFEGTIAAVLPDAENPRSRATYAIERLRAQRLIVRLDGAGMVRAGEYALSSLATDIVKRFLDDERLTREHLDGLMTSVVAGLTELRNAAAEAKGEDAWRLRVQQPLELVVTELLNGVERRQLGLDEQQTTIRGEITRLLEADWLDALGSIEHLLDETAQTLTELKALLLQHANQAHAIIDDVVAFAQAQGRIEVYIASRRTADQLDRLLAWGQSRHEAWSEYHRSVHRFLRDVVRLDPDRQLSARLRQQITGFPEKPFVLRLARGPRLLMLRPPERPLEHPPVRRPSQDWTPDLHRPLGAAVVNVGPLVDLALASGARSLAHVLDHVLDAVPDEGRYAAIGQVAARVAPRAQGGHGGQGPWAPVADGRFEVTDWALGPPPPPPPKPVANAPPAPPAKDAPDADQ